MNRIKSIPPTLHFAYLSTMDASVLRLYINTTERDQQRIKKPFQGDIQD